MTRKDFLNELAHYGIDPRIVSFDNCVNDGYCVRKNHFRWETFIRERGTENNVMGFSSESDALESLLERLINLYCNENMRVAQNKLLKGSVK